MSRLSVAVALALLAVCAAGCKTEIGGPKLDNPTGTYANKIDARNLGQVNSPAPAGITQ